MDVSKNRGKTPKMDGENNGKAYFLMDDLGGKPTIFGNPQMDFHVLEIENFSTFGYRGTQIWNRKQQLQNPQLPKLLENTHLHLLLGKFCLYLPFAKSL